MAETTNSIVLIESAPSGDAVNGAFTESFSPTAIYISTYTESGQIFFVDMYQTDSITLIDATPNGDAVNGYFVSSFAPTAIYVATYTESGQTLESLTFENVSSLYVTAWTQHIGQRVQYSQGIKLGQGMEFYKKGDIYKSGGGDAFFGSVY